MWVCRGDRGAAAAMNEAWGHTLVTTAPRNENFSFYVISVRFFPALPPSLLLLLRFVFFFFSLLCFAHFSITFEFLSECRPQQRRQLRR